MRKAVQCEKAAAEAAAFSRCEGPRERPFFPSLCEPLSPLSLAFPGVSAQHRTMPIVAIRALAARIRFVAVL
jgi:hypothetical protein